jgi:hypothetical protein
MAVHQSFIKIGQLVEKVKGRHKCTQHLHLITLLSFVKEEKQANDIGNILPVSWGGPEELCDTHPI